MKDALKNDRARIQVGRISHFGLLEMSRQRIRTGVLEGSTVVCPHCLGAGVVRSTSSVALHVLRVLEDALIKSAAHDMTVRARTPVALYILNQKRAHLRDLERRFGVAIMVEADDTLTGSNYHAIERGEPASGRQGAEEAARESEVRPAGYGAAPADDEEFAIEEEAEAEEPPKAARAKRPRKKSEGGEAARAGTARPATGEGEPRPAPTPTPTPARRRASRRRRRRRRHAATDRRRACGGRRDRRRFFRRRAAARRERGRRGRGSARARRAPAALAPRTSRRTRPLRAPERREWRGRHGGTRRAEPVRRRIGGAFRRRAGRAGACERAGKIRRRRGQCSARCALAAGSRAGSDGCRRRLATAPLRLVAASARDAGGGITSAKRGCLGGRFDRANYRRFVRLIPARWRIALAVDSCGLGGEVHAVCARALDITKF